jgi:hypothetical protein
MKILKYFGLTAVFAISWFAALVVVRITEILVLKHPMGHAGKGHVLVLAAVALLANISIWTVAATAYARLGRWWRKLSARGKLAAAKKAEKIATAVMFFGAICFLPSFVMALSPPPYIRPPLICFSDIAADSSGLIYCSQSAGRGAHYCEIQVYSPQGRYLRSFHLGDNPDFSYDAMNIDGSNRICLADDSTRRVFVFDRNGHRLETHPYPDGCNHIASNEECKDKAGNVYSLSPLPLRSIWKTDSSGRTSIFVIDPPYFWFIYPAVAFSIIIAGRLALEYFRGLG